MLLDMCFYNNPKTVQKIFIAMWWEETYVREKKLISKINMNSKENISLLKRSWSIIFSRNKKLEEIYASSSNTTTSIYKSYCGTEEVITSFCLISVL